jgi:hypothetical protein
MAVNRIEVAIECDDAMGEGLQALAMIVQTFGMDPNEDVEVVLSSSEDGTPVVMAVLGKEMG